MLRTWPLKPNTTGCRPSLLATGRVSVKDHGAKGDGLHDDAPALRLAIEETWHCGGSVVFPTGNYLINSTVQLAHCSLIGIGNEPVGYEGAAAVVAYDTGPAVRLFTRNPAGPVLQVGYLRGDTFYNTTMNQTLTAGVYLEKLAIEGLETGMVIANTCWVRLRNCGVSATACTGVVAPPHYNCVGGTKHNTAMVLVNNFWIWFEEGGSFSFHPGKGLLPSVIMQGGPICPMAQMCTNYAVRFDRITFQYGGVRVVQLVNCSGPIMNIDFLTTCMEDTAMPLFDIWVDPAVTNFAGLEHITISDYMDADSQSSSASAKALLEQPIIGFNCSAPNCVFDGLTIMGANVGDPTKHPSLINFNPSGGRVHICSFA
jgi:hypothetical protein